MRHIRKMSQGNLRLHAVEGVTKKTQKMEKNWVWRQGKKYPIKMSKHVKHKGRDFDWERLACAITSHIGKLQNYPAKMPVSILKRTGTFWH